MRPRLGALLFVVGSGIGCVSAVHHDMRDSALGPAPASGEARVLFYRPPSYWRNTAAWEVRDAERLVGIVENGGALEYRCPPGSHLFFLDSSSAQAVDADLAGGRTYFVEIRMQTGLVVTPALLPRRLGDPEDRKACEEGFGRCGVRELRPDRASKDAPEKTEELRKRIAEVRAAELLKLRRDDGD